MSLLCVSCGEELRNQLENALNTAKQVDQLKAQLEQKLKRQKTESEQDQSPIPSTHQTDLKASQGKHDQIEEEKEGGRQ